MRTTKYKLATDDLDKTVNYLIERLDFDYENHSINMSVLALEEFYFRNSSTQLNMIIAKREESYILIDVMGSAGGTGIFNINWWSEKGYIKRVKRVLDEYAEEFSLTLEELETS